MVASLQCRCHLETATIKHRIERNDDQIEPFFDSIDPQRSLGCSSEAASSPYQSTRLSRYDAVQRIGSMKL